MKITFSSTHTAFQVIAPKDTLVSLSETPTEIKDGVYVIGDDGVINIDEERLTDSVYLSTVGSDYTVALGQRTAYPFGDNTVIIRAGSSAIPFKKGPKGGGGAAYIGETTTEITNGSDVNPIVINGTEVKAKSGDIVKYVYTYYLFNGSVWSEFIDTSDLIVGLLDDEVVIGELVTDE